MSEGISAMFGESLRQAWVNELAKVKEDSDVLTSLISASQQVRDVEGLRKFHDKVKEALRQVRTEDAKEALKRVAEATEQKLQKEQRVERGGESRTTEKEGVMGTTQTTLGPGGKGGNANTCKYGLYS